MIISILPNVTSITVASNKARTMKNCLPVEQKKHDVRASNIYLFIPSLLVRTILGISDETLKTSDPLLCQNQVQAGTSVTFLTQMHCKS